MSIHNKIVLSAAPAGRFLEGTISGTPKPGTMLQVAAGTEPVGGKYTWEAYSPGTDGDRRLVTILLPQAFRGQDLNQAYLDGEQCQMYCPIQGDEMKVLLLNISGTSDSFAIGDLLIADTGTGKFIATTGSVESEPFVIMETVAAITADTLALVQYTGH